MYLVSAAQMQNMDRETIESFGIPGQVLMENAGKGSFDMLVRLFQNLESKKEISDEVMFEEYTMKIQIEARVLGDLVINHIVPTAVKYQSTLMDNVIKLKELFVLLIIQRLEKH